MYSLFGHNERCEGRLPRRLVKRRYRVLSAFLFCGRTYMTPCRARGPYRPLVVCRRIRRVLALKQSKETSIQNCGSVLRSAAYSRLEALQNGNGPRGGGRQPQAAVVRNRGFLPRLFLKRHHGIRHSRRSRELARVPLWPLSRYS